MARLLLSLPPAQRSHGSLEQALDQRRSCRRFVSSPLLAEEIGQLLWAAQGMNRHGTRTSPSAGARYPLEIYAVLPEGVGHYDPRRHALRGHMDGDQRRSLSRAALAQEFVLQAPLTVVICAVYERVAVRYGEERGARYVILEAGHAAQNILLQATTLGLGAVPVGAFDDDEVRRLLELPDDHAPLYLLTVGRPEAST